MAVLTVFHFADRNSPLNRADPRAKLFCMAGLTIAAFLVTTAGDLVLILLLAAAYGWCRVSPLRPLWESRVFLLFVAVATVSRIVSGHLTAEAFASGGAFALQLLIALLASNLFSKSTSPSAIRDAIVWLARPIPGFDANRLGFLFMTTLALVPALVDAASTSREALVARCLRIRRRPFYSIRVATMALLRSAFERATTLAYAVEARGYRIERDHLRDGVAVSRQLTFHASRRATAGAFFGCAAGIVLSVAAGWLRIAVPGT